MEDKHLTLKHRFAFGVTIGVFFCFTLLVYSPMFLYVTGSDEMWFSFKSLLTPVLIVAPIAAAVSSVILSLPKGAVHKLLCCLVFGLTLGFYIQCSFFNISYGSGVLDGSQIAWKDYTTYGAIDSAMWAACIALPFAVFMVFKRSWRHILMAAAIFILLLQVGGLAINLYQNQNTLDKLSHEVTTQGIYDLSEGDNTLVFVMDSMDAEYYQEYKKAHPEITEELSGFTEYENAMSAGSDSLESIPAMLTGDIYKKDIKYTDFINNSWKRNNVFDVLSRSGADVRIYTDDKYFGNGAVAKIDNVVDRAQDAEAYRVIGTTMYRYTMYNAMPHYLKRLFWMSLNDYSNFQSNDVYELGSDDLLYEGLEKNGGFNYTGSYGSAVRIYHLKGASHPYRLTSKCEKDTGGTSRPEQVEGGFLLLRSMLDKLKESGKYENATIIIAGNQGENEYGQRPMLLYKEKGKASKYRTSGAPVSLFDLPATLASTVTKDYKGIGSGETFRDAEKMPWTRTRSFYRSTGSNANSRIEEYSLIFTEPKTDNLTLTNKYYVNGGRIDNYILGTELTFTEDETAAVYCKEGFGHTNGWRTIITGSKAVMEIPIDKIPDNVSDLHAYFSVLNIYEETRCVITANGETVFDGKLGYNERMNGLNFLVPIRAIAPGNTLTLTFSFPEIENDKDIMALTSFKIYNQ